MLLYVHKSLYVHDIILFIMWVCKCTPCPWCVFVPFLFCVLICRVAWPSIWSCSSLTRRRHTLRQAHHFTIMFSSISSLNPPKYPQDDPGKGKLSHRSGPDEALSPVIARCPPGHPTLVWEKPAHHNALKMFNCHHDDVSGKDKLPKTAKGPTVSLRFGQQSQSQVHT